MPGVEWVACKNYFNDSCAYCGLHIDEHFEEFNQDLHRDHVNHEGANDLSNCIPACKRCNGSKWKFELVEWYSEKNENYSIERLGRIHKWLNEDYLLVKS
ncbi:HNH endonuclease [Cytobacillus praedii]|uniref:HNH endonuclease n=1 Tax=Cytobacillus praedii TaxID=1742358 RepID=UPI00399D4D1B